jgi:xanthine dehydrogenase small subunit
MTTQSIRFFQRNALREVHDVPASRTVLQHLREHDQCTGTKEGCAEGDCGACTVVIGELDAEGQPVLKAVNACIQFMPTLDGRALFTVEDLRAKDGTLHPVQQAMVDCHGSQCGFCTPGFVMSMWALYENQPADAGLPTRDEINTALSGNLCRCTGYRPIVDASQKMFEYPRAPFDRDQLKRQLESIQRKETLEYSAPDARGAAFGHPTFFAPVSLAEFARLRAGHPDARILAGSTDLGLWVTKQFRNLGDILYIGNVTELKSITRDGQWLTIGAAASLEDSYAALSSVYPELAELWTRFASLPIRNAGTLGGNVANGSPIGDSMPALIALDAEIVLQKATKVRTMPLDAFYLGYQKSALETGEFVAGIRVPLPSTNLRFRTYKVSKRYDQDISAVCAAFAVTLDGSRVSAARFAFGGMAATPKRASNAEAVLVNEEWNEANVKAAMRALDVDFQPLTDMRASSEYRSKVARNVLWRFFLETREDSPLALRDVNAFAFDVQYASMTPDQAPRTTR